MSYHVDIVECWGKLIDQRGDEAETRFAGSVSAWQNTSNVQLATIRTVATCTDSKARIDEALHSIKAYKAALRR